MEKKTQETDLYGFPLTKPLPEPNPRVRSQSMKKTNARLEKWRFWLKFHSEILEKRPIPLLNKKKLRSRLRKGIPESLRGQVWCHLARISQLQIKLSDFSSAKVLDEIKLDVDRTFPAHEFFKEQLGKSTLKKVLAALAEAFPRMGYCQGLNFLAAGFSMFVDDEKAFLLLYSLIKTYNMEPLYTDLTLLLPIFRTFEDLMNKFMPKVAKKLKKLGLNPEIYATSWFLTFFVDRLNFSSFLRLLDVFFLEERKILYRVGLAVMKLKSHVILEKSSGFEEIMMELKNFDGKLWQDPDLLMKTAVSFKFSGKWLKGLEKKHLEEKK